MPKDKMPTEQNANGQNANRTKCQLKVGILSGLFSVVGILSVLILGWHFVRTISTCFCILLLTVVGEKVDKFLLLNNKKTIAHWISNIFVIFKLT